jgi:Zn-dependent protease with chaperone function
VSERLAVSAWRGQFMDGRTAALRELHLAVVEGALVGRDDAGVVHLRWPTAAIRSEELDAARVLVTSTTEPEARLTTGADELAVHLGHAEAVLRPPSRRLRLAAYGVGAIVAAALVYASLDPLSRVVARRIPLSYEASLGRGLGDVLAKGYCETPQAKAALGRLADRVGGGASELHVLDADMVNAFTLPGGIVVVTRGLLAELQSSDELAGILAHELEHSTRRHIMIHVVRGSLMTLAWQATVGDYSGLLVVDPKTAMDVANLRFSRDAEREADRGARARLDAARISVTGLRQFFERMRAKTDQVPAWLSNHPSSAERAAAIGDEVGAVARTPALSAEDWAALRAGCTVAAKPSAKTSP